MGLRFFSSTPFGYPTYRYPLMPHSVRGSARGSHFHHAIDSPRGHARPRRAGLRPDVPASGCRMDARGRHRPWRRPADLGLPDIRTDRTATIVVLAGAQVFSAAFAGHVNTHHAYDHEGCRPQALQGRIELAVAATTGPTHSDPGTRGDAVLASTLVLDPGSSSARQDTKVTWRFADEGTALGPPSFERLFFLTSPKCRAPSSSAADACSNAAPRARSGVCSSGTNGS